MRITFLIGNGFDIAVGLNTGYRDFYKYCKNEHADTCKNNIILSNIMEKPEQWSDMEIALGNFKNEDIDANRFLIDKEKVEELLENYLLSEENRVVFSDTRNKQVSKEIISSIVRFYNNHPQVFMSQILTTVNSISSSIKYTCINFNYTNVYDRCWDIAKKSCDNKPASHVHGTTRYEDSFDIICHVNGVISQGIILGVNDDNQIKQKSLKIDKTIQKTMIKTNANNCLGQGRVDEAQRIISESRVICIYGMSLGFTDQIWWNSIYKWLVSDKANILVIYDYKPKTSNRISVYGDVLSRNDILRKFAIGAGVEMQKTDEIDERIFTKLNPDIFRFKVTENKNNG